MSEDRDDRPPVIGVGTLNISPRARALVNEVLDSNRLSYGPMTRRFEAGFARAHGCRFGVMSNSGTSALLVALAALKELHGWADGDEVILPAVTFAGTANIVFHARMRPVLVDVDPIHYELDPEKIEAAVTSRTRALIPVHVFGQPCDMDPVLELARRYGLRVIEDSAETMFARYKGRSVGSLGEISIVGSGLPVSTGAALAYKMRGEDKVSLCFFGDGASSQGTFHESLNLAAIWKLPVVYVCENNGYGELTSAKDAISVEDISVRAVGYDMPGVTVDGQDALAVFEAVSEAVERARGGGGPSLVETKTYRFENHAIGRLPEHYRSAEEVEYWRTQRDPLVLFRQVLLERGFDEQQIDDLEAAVSEEIVAAIEFARQSPSPPPEAAFTHLFANPASSAG